HLGASDRGVVLFRQMLRQQIERVQQGLDPLGIIRDPECKLVELPMWIVADDNLAQGEEFAAQAALAKLGQSMSAYFDEREGWFDVPEGAARKPGTLS